MTAPRPSLDTNDDNLTGSNALAAGRESHRRRLPSRGLLSFYDDLRDRVVAAAENRDGRWAPRLVEFLLLVPDVFMLILRLSLDREVPREERALLGGALCYFILPFDLWPEGAVGPVGYVDDLVLGVAVLAQAFSRDLEPYAEKYWSGRRPVRRVLADVLQAARSLLGSDLYGRLGKVLRRRGIDLEAVGSSVNP